MFSREEILELEALEIRGGADASICSQTKCINDKAGCGGGVDQTECVNKENLCGALLIQGNCPTQGETCHIAL